MLISCIFDWITMFWTVQCPILNYEFAVLLLAIKLMQNVACHYLMFMQHVTISDISRIIDQVLSNPNSPRSQKSSTQSPLISTQPHTEEEIRRLMRHSTYVPPGKISTCTFAGIVQALSFSKKLLPICFFKTLSGGVC